jgi:adenylate cyclase
MKPQGFPKKSRALFLDGILGALITVLAGLVCLLPVGDGLARLSYDLGFCWAKERVPDDLLMVYLDDSVKRNLGEPVGQPLDRHYYSLLLNRLTHDGARLVFFDILFDDPSTNPAVDAQFADIIRLNGHVVLIGGYERVLQGNVQTDELVPPSSILCSVAPWGTADCPLDPDYGIRRLALGTKDEPSAGWVAASILSGAEVTNRSQEKLSGMWLDYYCPPGRLRSVDLDQVLATNGLPDGYFHDKIVVVGARPGVGIAGDKREMFRTPYTLLGWADAPGPAVQGFNLLNLTRGDWLKPLPPPVQAGLFIVWGIVISLALLAFRPWPAILVASGCFAGIGLFAIYVHDHWQIWFSWLVPAGVQLPVALLWAVGYHYLIADQRRRQLRKAFSAYLSPYMADRIANSQFDLALGGQEVEASVMFTDLEGFTKMSEPLSPAEVSQILTTYFNQTTRAILDQDGTIIKYIGDAVMAVWGAPLPEKHHAQRAVMAAWGMNQAGKQEVIGRRLRTRIGINTGMVLAGNLGSDFRFDYTCIGDTTNFASRLEGLNKYLGTEVLISEFTAQQLDETIKLRHVGRFIVVGKRKPIGIYEVLGPITDFSQDPLWLAEFATALEHFRRGEFGAAEKIFQQVITLRAGGDGPSGFYLKQIAKHAGSPGSDTAWDGAVRLDEK